MSCWIPAYVALGSNLGDPQQQIRLAFERLAQLADTRLVARSQLYRTRPMGPQDQPDFINAAAGLLTLSPPHELLAQLKAIERSMGRTDPPVRWGPRLIDLDLLAWGSTTLSEPQLTLPHPGVLERNFVLFPLADIAPTLRIGGREPVAALAQRLGSDGLQLLDG